MKFIYRLKWKLKRAVRNVVRDVKWKWLITQRVLSNRHGSVRLERAADGEVVLTVDGAVLNSIVVGVGVGCQAIITDCCFISPKQGH